jgi:hypothetical protein
MMSHRICIVALCASACVSEPIRISSDTQAEMELQGTQLQGIQLQGIQAPGLTLQGFQFAGATLGDAALSNLRIERGELVAEQDQVTRRGADLINAHVFASAQNLATSPPVTETIEYRISGIEAEDPRYDPTSTGSTFLYTLEQNVGDSGSWQPACAADSDGRHAALPLAATWDGHGNRIASSTQFTFGCTTGVVAKCYRWGYRPWVTGYGDLATVHWICTRAARADYCGNGRSHTRDGTLINVWDNLPAPGPIQAQGQMPTGMLFEAGWSTGGAVCLSHARWLLGGALIAAACPDRLIAPGLGLLGGTVCDLTAQVLGQAGDARMFNESNLNINLDLL